MAELPNAAIDPDLRRQVMLDMQQLASDGYGEQDIRDYALGFKEGYGTASPVGMAGKVVQGLALGYGDEIKGVVRSAFTDKSRLYETARARGQLARAGRDAPITSAGLEVAGSVAPAVLGGLGLVGRAATLGGNIARGAAAGALQGGIYGSGEQVGGVESRLAGAVPGAIAGGVVGGAVVPVAELGLAAGRRVGAALSQRGGEAQARRAFRTALDETGDSALNIRARMEQARGNAAGTPMTMAEAIGQQGTDLLETAAQAPGAGREAIVRQLGERQQAQPERLVNALRRTSGVDRGAVDSIEAARRARSNAARPLYEQLGGIDAPDDVMQNMRLFLQSRAGRAAYRRAADFAEQAQVRGEPFGALPSLQSVLDGARLTAGEADVILQGLEATAERKMLPGAIPGARNASKESIAYNRTADMLRGQMQRSIPEFERARAAWAGPSQFIDAIKQGDKALGMDLDTFRTVWRGSNAAQQDGIRVGLVNALKADLEQFAAGETADASRNLARRFAVREKLRLTLGEQADELMRAIDAEAQTSRAASQALGNSATARRQAAAQAMGDEAMSNVPTSPHGILGRIIGRLDEFARRNTRNSIARLGLTTDPHEAEALVQSILTQTPNRPSGAVPGAFLGGPAGVASATVFRPEDRR